MLLSNTIIYICIYFISNTNAWPFHYHHMIWIKTYMQEANSKVIYGYTYYANQL